MLRVRGALGALDSWCPQILTKEEARKALREAHSNADAGLVFDAGKLTVGEYLDRWLADSVKDTVR